MKLGIAGQFSIIASLAVALAASSAEAEDVANKRGRGPLGVAQGTMAVGGVLIMETHIAVRENDHRGSFSMTIAPYFGYFVIDGLELGGRFRLTYHTGEEPDRFWDAGTVGFDFGVRYIFRIHRVVNPYLGGYIGFTFGRPDTFDIEFPAGLMLALNPFVAVDLGFRIRTSIHLDGPEADISLPMGYFGIVGFF